MPKKENPGGGGKGGGGGGGDIAFVVRDVTGDAIIGTGPAGEDITVHVTRFDGSVTWELTTKVDINGNWSVYLADLVNMTTGKTDFLDASGDFTIVAFYLQTNLKNDRTKTVSTEPFEFQLESANSPPDILVDGNDSASATLDESDAGLSVSGGLTVTDVDGPDVVTASIDSVVVTGATSGAPNNTTLLRMLSLVPSTAVALGSTAGSITWTFDSGSEAFDYLASGQSLILDYTIAVSDGKGGTDSQIVRITITGTDEAPVIDTTAPTITGPTSLVLDENQTRTAEFVFSANETVAWSLSGTDSQLFEIDVDGLLSFKVAPDFETPTDTDGDGIYHVTIAATDLAENTSTRGVSVTVANVVEDPPSMAYTSVVVFGDSLSDNGNFSDLAANFFVRDDYGQLIYTVPFQFNGGDGSVRTYDSRSFSDGTTYADTLAGLLSLDGAYQNYAFGGAEALGSKLGSSYITEYSNLTYTTVNNELATFSIIQDTEAALLAYGNFDINLTAQVDRFIAHNPDGAPEGTLAVLNIGGNDLGKFDTNIINVLFGGISRFADDLGSQIEAQARRLADAGVSGIAFYTLPVAEFFVGYEDLISWLEQPLASDLLDAVNGEIITRAGLLNNVTTEVVRIDIMSEELLADMQTHGFLYKGPYLQGYSGDPTWVETSPGVIEPIFTVEAAATAYRAEQILFFDEIHPSGALHDLLAVFSSESLSTEQVFGSGGADSLTMSAADDFVLARGGNDVITLGLGDDVALGGTGDDTLRGEGGADLLIGGAGNDSLEGGDGSDLLAGSAGNDQLSGGADADILIGGLGSDIVLGEAGDDVFIFFEEALWGGAGGSIDLYDGGDGTDMLFVFLSETAQVSQSTADGGATVLSFGQGYQLTAQNIETIEVHTGLPEDADSPLATLALSMPDDLLARYEEAELWGIV